MACADFHAAFGREPCAWRERLADLRRQKGRRALGIGGGAGDVLLEAVYAGGHVVPYTFDFTDWCSPGQLAPGEFPADIMPNLQQASGTGKGTKMVTAYSGCGGLYAVAIPIDSSRTLAAISIPGSVASLLAGVAGGAQNDFVTAISLQR